MGQAVCVRRAAQNVDVPKSPLLSFAALVLSVGIFKVIRTGGDAGAAAPLIPSRAMLARTTMTDAKEAGTTPRRAILVVAVIVPIGATACGVSGDSFAQEKSVTEQLDGGWTLVSVANTQPDGT